MDFDPIVINPGRLRILTALALGQTEEFVRLRELTCLTDGNLASHGRRLKAAGLISIDKTFREGKSLTLFRLNRAGRAALEEHAREVLAAISGPVLSRPVDLETGEYVADHDEEWVD
jgi:DNA-binding transcriptional ArsR family regulator